MDASEDENKACDSGGDAGRRLFAADLFTPAASGYMLSDPISDCVLYGNGSLREAENSGAVSPDNLVLHPEFFILRRGVCGEQLPDSDRASDNKFRHVHGYFAACAVICGIRGSAGGEFFGTQKGSSCGRRNPSASSD